MRYAADVHRAWPWLLSMCLLACAGEAPGDVEPSAADTEIGPSDASQSADDVVSPPRASDVVTVDSEGEEDVTVEVADAEPTTDTTDAQPAVEEVIEDVSDGDTPPDGGAGDAPVVIPPEDVGPEGPQPIPEGASPGRAPMRRLTRSEADLTIRDLTGLTGMAASTLPPEPETQGFDNHVDAQSVGQSFVEAQLLMAEAVAAEVDLQALLPCDPVTEGEVVCGHAFITEFGRRAFRQPLTEPQHARFAALFQESLPEWGFEEATRLVLTALMMSPHFIYRVELGVPSTEVDGVVRPSPHEMASRLSYLLYGSMPDEELSAAADAGELMTAQSVNEQAARMLDAFGAREMMDRFHRQWLHLDRLLFMAPVSTKFASFRTESRLFIQHTLFEGEGSFSALMTSPEMVLY